MKNVFKSVIAKGGYDLPDMLRKIDSYHIDGKLSDAERTELYALARGAADPAGSLNLLAKVMELEERVQRLEDSNTEQPETSQQPAEYVPGKWYYNGNKVTFEGAVYTCTAPEGVVCTWSPAEFPAYWEADSI